MHFRAIYSSSEKNVINILMRLASNVQLALSSISILAILILPIREHGWIFPFFGLFSFIRVLSF
jgi:hypothetical protein